MDIELILMLIALFTASFALASFALAITVSVSLRIHRLEHEMDMLRFNVPDYTDKDIPAFLRRQAD